MHFFRSVLFYVFSIPFCFSNVDYKCDNGVPIAIQWWNQEPYIYHVNSHFETQPDSANKSQGLFPWFLKHVLSKCCRASTANYTKISGPAGLPGVLSIGDFDLILPVVSKLEAVSVRGFPYVGVFESPGVAFLTKGNVSGTQLLFAVLGAWPILVFILMSAALAGVIIWLLERKHNTEQFPESFGRGVFEGFWWAFITMTTVGYGDKAPQTVLGKLLGFVWMLAGLIIVTMFISMITSAMTSVSLSGTSSIRGVTVSAVNQSEEHKLGTRQLARVQALPSSHAVFQEMFDRSVDGALVDIHGLKHHIPSLRSHNIQVGTILANHVMYGVLLGRNSSNLENCMRELVKQEEFNLFQLLADYTGATQTTISTAEDYFGSGGIFSVTVYAGISLFVLLFAAGMTWEFYKKRRTTENKDDGDEQGENISCETRQARLSHRKSEVALELTPTPRLSFGESVPEQLLSRQSMEVICMDEDFRDFRENWVAKYASMMERHEQQRLLLVHDQTSRD